MVYLTGASLAGNIDGNQWVQYQEKSLKKVKSSTTTMNLTGTIN